VRKFPLNESQNRPKKPDFRIIELEVDIFDTPEGLETSKKPVFCGLFALLEFPDEKQHFSENAQNDETPRFPGVSRKFCGFFGLCARTVSPKNNGDL
jgi:hypothetical protein